MSKVLLEICCGSLDDAIEAEKGGADRVELCSALFLGGLTPSYGTIAEAKRRLKIPVMVMIRPRGGGFCYSEAEFASMLRDTEAAVELGADGIVFGILDSTGAIDVERSRALCAKAARVQRVFHRAFDVTPDPFVALEQLIELRISRVLTSGQQPTVPEGAHLIRDLITSAAGRIEVLPGGGINEQNLSHVLQQTKCSQVHLTAFKTAQDTSVNTRPEVTFGGALYPPENSYQVTNDTLVARIKQALPG
jgi:copper homeostasis protein